MGNAALPSVSDQETGKLRRVRQRTRIARLSRRAALTLGLLSLVIGAAAGVSIELSRSHPGATWTLGSQASHTGGAVARPVFTVPSPAGAQFTGQPVPTDSKFAAYYVEHDGEVWLGTAVTPALPVAGGWLQVFMAGALYAPDATAATGPQGGLGTSATDDTSHLAQLIKGGSTDQQAGVISLPILPLLLAVGSQVHVGPSAAPLSYADLRAANDPQRRVKAPAWYRSNAPSGPDGTFIPEEMRLGVSYGHMVPAAFWAALNDPKLAPDGWAADFGRPLTEALVARETGGGQGQTLVAQLFEHAALMQVLPSAEAGAAAGAPQMLPVGLDYLRTFGPPPLRNLAGATEWSAGAVSLREAAGEQAATQASLGEHFPLTLLGGAQWADGTLWYQASWRTPLRNGTGWVSARSLMASEPAGVASVGFDALDPGLASYLAGLGGRVGAVVYDVTHSITYQYNPGGSFTVASSVKVPIMLALLTKLEAQGREPNGNEMSLLTTMIENSNNDSAQALYEEIGDAPGLAAFMAQVGIPGLKPLRGAWGWSTITPQAMVSLLSLLQQGKILTSAHRALAMSLMGHIEPDQRTGVGSTAPASAIVAMKDGWVPAPDGLWAVNTSGIVTIGPETYIISIYTLDDPDLSTGWAITEHVSGAVAQLLS